MTRRVLLCLTVVAGVALGDVLALRDGRFVDNDKIEKAAGGYFVHFENGKIFVPAELVIDYLKERDGQWTPRTPEEKEKHEKGLVRWRGRWVSKPYRARMRQKALDKETKRIEQQKARRKWRNHATVKTRKFVYLHTLPDETFGEIQDLFEAYYDFFTKYWRIRPHSKFGKPRIHIYHSREYFNQVSGAPEGVVGYYHPLLKELHFYYDRHHHRFTLDVMFHEGNHMLTHMIDEGVLYPWWINEGMAEYFGASRWDPIKKTMSLGHLQSARLAVLEHEIEADRWQDLDKMLRAQRMGAVQYSWAWSLCHFLLSHPTYAKGFKKLYLALGRSSSVKKKHIALKYKMIEPDEVIKALKRYLKIKSVFQLENEWYQYIQDHLTKRKGDLDYGQAAWIMTLYGEPKKARSLFRKAIKNGSKEAYVHYGYAELRYKTKPALAKKHAELATRFDPLHARAWALRGFCIYKEDPKEGRRLLDLAEEIAPDDMQIWLWKAEAGE